jgi:SAM-dependent methyltransferase
MMISRPLRGNEMAMDVVDLREFYASPLGKATRRLILSRLAPKTAGATERVIMGLGFPVPYMAKVAGDRDRSLAFMMARQGVIHWPMEGGIKSALVDEFDLPLLESVVDLALVVHGLELTDNPLEMLQEIWRVLSPQGRMILIVPNRRGLWAGFDSSPFGFGQPFSRSQLGHLLKDAQFSAVSWTYALHMPPSSRKWLLSSAPALEKLGDWTAQRFSGILIVEAVKQVYAFSAGKRARRLVPRFRPVLLPSPARFAPGASGQTPQNSP